MSFKSTDRAPSAMPLPRGMSQAGSWPEATALPLQAASFQTTTACLSGAGPKWATSMSARSVWSDVKTRWLSRAKGTVQLQKRLNCAA